MDSDLPPLQNLQAIRQRLIEQIAAAEKLFIAQSESRELKTSRAALKHIEDAIRSSLQQASNQSSPALLEH